MDPLTLAGTLLKLATTLLGLSEKFQTSDKARKENVQKLFNDISNCLASVSSEIRCGRIPHGHCGELRTYAEQLPSIIKADVGDDTAIELSETLHSAYNVEEMAARLGDHEDKETVLRQIEEASGKFRALANMVNIA